MGRFEGALADFDAAIAPLVDGERRDILRACVTLAVNRARLSEFTGNPEAAIASARTGVELVPHEARAHYWLVQLLWRHGTPEEAAQALDAFGAVKSASHNASFPFWADMLAAEGALQEGALAQAREALSRAALHPRVTRDLPVQHWLDARLSEAEADVPRAIEEYGAVASTYFWYVEAHSQLAIEARFRRACLQQDSGDPEFDRAVLEELLEAWGGTGLAMVEDARIRLAR